MKRNTNYITQTTFIEKIAISVVFIFSILIIVKIFTIHLEIPFIQKTDYSKLLKIYNKTNTKIVSSVAKRGNIYDRNGSILATSVPAYNIILDPNVFCKKMFDQASFPWPHESKKYFLTSLGKNGNGNELDEICNQHSAKKYYLFAKKITPESAFTAIPAGKHIAYLRYGIRREPVYERYYPPKSSSVHLVGFLKEEQTHQVSPQYGAELYLNDRLVGENGTKYFYKDKGGNYIDYLPSKAEKKRIDGESIALSVDSRLQLRSTMLLEDALKKYDAAIGSVVVISIPSGEVLAMANAPAYNPNNRNYFNSEGYRNRSITDLFEPGSTIKPFTIAYALGIGKVDLKEIIDTSPGYIELGSKKITDFKNYGKISAKDVVVKSSNVGTIKVTKRLDLENFKEFVTDLGFSDPPIDWGGVAPGSVLSSANTNRIDHISLGYGYGLNVSLLQLARAYTAFATEGKLLTLTLEKKEPEFIAKNKQVLKPSAAKEMRSVLAEVVTKGTGQKAIVPGYTVGGKTGTAIDFDVTKKQYYKNNKQYTATFVGLYPIENPRFVIAVLIDEVKSKTYYGGDVAAPIFSSITEYITRLYPKPDYRLSANHQITDEEQYSSKL